MIARIVLVATICLTLVPSEGRGEAHERSFASGSESQHVMRLLLDAETSLRACLVQESPEGEQLPPQVLARLEFPSGTAPRVITIDAWPGSAVDRCVRRALTTISTPAYQGPMERHECLIPLGEGTLRCRQHPSVRSDSPPEDESPPPDAPQLERDISEEHEDEPTSPPPHRKNSITVNPLGAIVGGVDIKYTRAFRHSSLGAAVAIQLPLRLDALGVLGLVEVLGWINDVPLSGFYAGAAIQVGGNFGPPDIIQVGPLAVIGLRWLFESGFTLGLGGSFGVVFFYSDCPGGCTAHSINGATRLDSNGRGSAFTARLAFDVGITF